MYQVTQFVCIRVLGVRGGAPVKECPHYNNRIVWLTNLKSQIGDLLLSPLLCGWHVVFLAMWLVR